MILTTHILSGAALGANIQNPYVVAGFSIVLHFLLDTLPHGDYLNKKSKLREFWKVAVDLAIGLGIVLSILHFGGLAPQNILNIGIGIFFSLFPDFTTLCFWKFKVKFLKPVKEFHENLHCHENGSPQREFRLKNECWEIAVSLISLIILISLLR